jgi:hypothetical protein
MVATGFPKLDERAAALPARPVAPPSQTAAAEPVATTAGNSLLARLKQQAAEKQASDAKSTGLQEQQRRQISEALQSTYSYLKDLVDQINVLKPAYPGSYFLNDQLNFDGLTWQEGRADFRKLDSVTEDRLFDRVSLRYLLASPTPLVVEKENPGLETLRRTLNDFGLPFELQEIKNDRARTERGRFTVKREIRAGLLFVADYEVGDIRLRSLNVQRLGSAEYRIPAEIMTHDTVEEIALLVLGESNQFIRRFKRVA